MIALRYADAGCLASRRHTGCAAAQTAATLSNGSHCLDVGSAHRLSYRLKRMARCRVWDGAERSAVWVSASPSFLAARRKREPARGPSLS